MDDPSVVALVLNWNNWEDTIQCIRSLKEQEYGDLNIIVIDNGSSDDSLSHLQQIDNIDLVRNTANLGFAGGMNRGIETALDYSPKYICVVNNDSFTVHSDTINSLVVCAENNDDVGIVSPIIKDGSGSKIWFEQGAINWSSATTYHKTVDQDRGLIYNEYIPMCFSLIRPEIFEEIGYFDEDYFLYYEDVDFCTRAKQRGWELATYLDTEVRHQGTASTSGEYGETMSYYQTRNKILFHKKHIGDLDASFHLLLLYWLAGRTFARIIRLNLGSIYALFRGVYDGMNGLTGKGPYP
ncbi:hypothetical protein HTG_00970 [Natrinema mahii]|nr:hypothetical protein HTG_00970 [Natrinema mahii]